MKLEILLLLAITYVDSTKTDDGKNVFIPTKQWQIIGEGQSIPPGLHVRIDLQTGKKEAKLLDENEETDEKNSAMAMSPVSPDDTAQEDPQTVHSRLKDALKNIPDEGIAYTEEKLKEISKKFKSYDTIKKELDEMNMQIKSDFQLMSDLFKKYDVIKGEQDLTEFRTLFEDLEYLLHQIDNANDFVTAGGLEKIVIPNLGNQTIPELRIHSVKLLGILVQNNPTGQIAAFEKNVGSMLLQMLSHSSSITTNEMSSIIFAFGGLLRKFPLAQEELLNCPGMKVLVDLLGKQVDYKIKIKCLLLISDLLREFDEAMGNDDLNKRIQYNATDMKNRLSSTEYCAVMIELLTVHRQDYLESLYGADDMLNVLIASQDICESQWSKDSIFRQSLVAIKSNYDRQGNAAKFDSNELNDVVEKLERLQAFIFNRTAVNDEL